VGRVTLEVSESQFIEWVQQISPEAKHDVLRALIPRLDAFEALVRLWERTHPHSLR
jgi:hypothetical protein